jgi:hypothetical protein
LSANILASAPLSQEKNQFFGVVSRELMQSEVRFEAQQWPNRRRAEAE